MTEQRLNEILDEQKIVRYRACFLGAMKRAVNEAIEECAIKADTKYIESDTNMNPGEVVVDRNSILNLKVK